MGRQVGLALALATTMATTGALALFSRNKPGGSSMMVAAETTAPAAQRVVFCPASAASALAEVPHVILGRSAAGDASWAAVGDAALLALKKRHPEVSLLYFSREDYAYAVRDLPPDEVEKAVRKRLERWSSEVLNQAPVRLGEEEQRILTLTALARAAGDAPLRDILDAHFERTLQLSADSNNSGSQSLTEALVLLLQRDAALLEEAELAEAAARQRGKGEAAGRLVREQERYRRDAGTLAKVLVRLGKDDFANYEQAPLYVNVRRGVYVHPHDPALLMTLRARGAQFVLWKEGVVTGWPLHDLEALASGGRSVEVLYPNSYAFLGLEPLTPAQLDRELEQQRRRQRGDAGGASAQDYLNDCRWTQSLLRRNTLAAARREKADASLIAALEAEVAEETTTLREALALRPSWLRAEAPPHPLTELMRTERQAVADAALLVQLAGLAGEEPARARFARKEQIKERHLALLSAALAPNKADADKH